MEEFIELEGRWATPEMEAAMRAGNRRDARRRREMEEEAKRETLIMDDEEDDIEEEENQVSLLKLRRIQRTGMIQNTQCNLCL